MRKHKPRVYLDTSVISYYTARLHPDPIIRARQLATRRWWETNRGLYDIHISTYVIGEIERGDPDAASKRIAAVEGFYKLHPTPDVERLARLLEDRLRFPSRSRMDANHLAIAAINSQDYIVSWNFKHMANAGVREAYRSICR
jgi:predicted nucleic acid-binding protein